MIYTRYGVKVKIKAHATDRSTVLVEALDDPEWQRVYDPAVLRADGGIQEVWTAMDECGLEYPPRPVACAAPPVLPPRNPITGRFVRGGEGGR